MRPLAAIIIWVVLVGGLYCYMDSRETIDTSPQIQVEKSPEIYKLIITTTFNTKKDPFVSKQGSGSGDAFSVKLNGSELVRSENGFEAGSAVVIENVDGVKTGANEFLLEANPSHYSQATAGAMRVQLFRSHEKLIDKTFWVDNGEKLVSTIRLDVVPGQSARNKDGH